MNTAIKRLVIAGVMIMAASGPVQANTHALLANCPKNGPAIEATLAAMLAAPIRKVGPTQELDVLLCPCVRKEVTVLLVRIRDILNKKKAGRKENIEVPEALTIFPKIRDALAKSKHAHDKVLMKKVIDIEALCKAAINVQLTILKQFNELLHKEEPAPQGA